MRELIPPHKRAVELTFEIFMQNAERAGYIDYIRKMRYNFLNSVMIISQIVTNNEEGFYAKTQVIDFMP